MTYINLKHKHPKNGKLLENHKFNNKTVNPIT